MLLVYILSASPVTNHANNNKTNKSCPEKIKSRLRNYFITLCLYYKNKLPKGHAGRWINSNLLYRHIISNKIPYEDWKAFILQQLLNNIDQWLEPKTLCYLHADKTIDKMGK